MGALPAPVSSLAFAAGLGGDFGAAAPVAEGYVLQK